MIEPVQFFKCLSDATRLKAVLLILNEGSLCVCELMECLADSQPKISRHLAQLRNCGVLTDQRQGQWVYYSISNDLPQWALDVLTASNQANSLDLQFYLKKLKAMKNRPICC